MLLMILITIVSVSKVKPLEKLDLLLTEKINRTEAYIECLNKNISINTSSLNAIYKTHLVSNNTILRLESNNLW